MFLFVVWYLMYDFISDNNMAMAATVTITTPHVNKMFKETGSMSSSLCSGLAFSVYRFVRMVRPLLAPGFHVVVLGHQSRR